MDRNFLASTKVGTPDPRQKDPPTGQQLLIAWGFSRGSYRKDLTLVGTVLFWDEEQKQFFHPVTRRFGTKAFFFPKKEILTYRLVARSKEGEEVACWEHQLWTEFIQIGDKLEVAE